MTSRIVIDCDRPGWETRMERHVRNGGEADLINFNLGVDTVFCVTLAECYDVEFRPSRTPGVPEATIRRPVPAVVAVLHDPTARLHGWAALAVAFPAHRRIVPMAP
jgi:hypothetical protein